MAVLIDTGVLLGALDADDSYHEVAASVLRRQSDELLVVSTVVAETAWQVERALGPHAEAAFLDSILAGELSLVELEHVDYARSTELIRRYADLGLGLVDASIIAVAERLDITTVATFNHRDFAVVRPSHVAALILIP
ncbi:MAG: type II toxin-antitoxin system VapC family toxin [Acidimicrobiales bacterium]